MKITTGHTNDGVYVMGDDVTVRWSRRRRLVSIFVGRNGNYMRITCAQAARLADVLTKTVQMVDDEADDLPACMSGDKDVL